MWDCQWEKLELALNPTVIIWAVLVLEVVRKMVAPVKEVQMEEKTPTRPPTIMELAALVDQLERDLSKEWNCFGNQRLEMYFFNISKTSLKRWSA